MSKFVASGAAGGGGSVQDATATIKGILQLAGDLGGTASAPTVPGLGTKLARVSGRTTITGNYTLVAADAVDKVLHTTAAGPLTITLPTDASVSIATEIAIPWRQYGAGVITFLPAAGVTLVSRGSVFKSAGQYAEGVVTKVAGNVWLLSGDVSA